MAARNHLDAHVPWLSVPVIEFLESRVRPDDHVFEYGGGGSTLWLAERAGRVVTVEHDPGWFYWIDHEVRRSGVTGCALFLCPPSAEEPRTVPHSPPGTDYGSSVGGNFEEYVTSIELFPADSLDLVLIDGRSRPACVVHAASKLRPGGTLVLDDSDRPAYRAATYVLDPWTRFDFRGSRTLSDPNAMVRTTCWVRPHRVQ